MFRIHALFEYLVVFVLAQIVLDSEFTIPQVASMIALHFHLLGGCIMLFQALL